MTSENNLDHYNFEQTNILINLQILPQSDSGERQTLIAVGIKDEPPIFRVISLEQLQLPPLITEMLEELNQELPNRKTTKAQQLEKQRIETLQKKYKKRQVEPPKAEASASSKSSNSTSITTQLSML